MRPVGPPGSRNLFGSRSPLGARFLGFASYLAPVPRGILSRFSLLAARGSTAICGVRTALSQLRRPQPQCGGALTSAETEAGRMCPEPRHGDGRRLPGGGVLSAGRTILRAAPEPQRERRGRPSPSADASRAVGWVGTEFCPCPPSPPAARPPTTELWINASSGGWARTSRRWVGSAPPFKGIDCFPRGPRYFLWGFFTLPLK